MVSREQRKQIARLLEGGWTASKIAKHMGLPPSNVRYAMVAIERAVMRDPNLRARSRTYTDAQIDEMVRRYTVDGVGSPQLAREFGGTFVTVLRALQRRGVVGKKGWAKTPETRVCRLCKTEKPLGQFVTLNSRPGAGGHGHTYECKACSRGQQRKMRLRHKYGLSEADVDRLASVQNRCCAICGKTPQRLCIDHNHTTGKVRGLLCHGCNTRLAAVENYDWLMKATEYLASYNALASTVQ